MGFGFKLPRYLTPPAAVRAPLKQLVVKAAVNAGAAFGGEIGANIAKGIAGKAFDQVTGSGGPSKAEKAAASAAATSSGGSTSIALNDVPSSGEPAARKPVGLFESFFHIFGF